MVSVMAVYKDGVFRPANPVAIPDGEQVYLTATPVDLGPTDPAEREYAARLDAATSLQEMLAVMSSGSDEPDPAYEQLLEDINARRTRVRFPEPDQTAEGQP